MRDLLLPSPGGGMDGVGCFRKSTGSWGDVSGRAQPKSRHARPRSIGTMPFGPQQHSPVASSYGQKLAERHPKSLPDKSLTIQVVMTPNHAQTCPCSILAPGLSLVSFTLGNFGHIFCWTGLSGRTPEGCEVGSRMENGLEVTALGRESPKPFGPILMQ